MSDHKRYEFLVQEIKRHNVLYYEQSAPLIPDQDYDLLYKELEALELAHPEWISPDSPTQKVGGAPSQKFEQVRHQVPMMSLSNTYSEEEISRFYERILKLTEGSNEDISFTCEPKIDGIATTLIYENGEFVLGATRGDGQTGENITENLKTLKDVPNRLSSGDWTQGRIEIRGEAYMDIDGFHTFNEKRQEEGLKVFANPRNATAGSLKTLNVVEVAQRPLRFFAYELIIDGNNKAWTGEKHSDRLILLEKMGFIVPDWEKVKTVVEIQDFWLKLEEKRNSLNYDIDGVVIKLDSLFLRQELGTTAKSPRWAIAYKFKARRAETFLKKITHQVGRTGAVTPVGEFEPVLLAGSVIKRATLHNADEIRRLGLGEGMNVIIEKAGDVIPKVIKRADGVPEGKYIPPENCPDCNNPLVQPDGEVIRRCVNISCPAMKRGRLIHFASRGAMDIEGLGEKTVDLLLDSELKIDDPGDFYSLTFDQVQKLEGFADLSATNLVKAIKLSLEQTLDRVIFALGIRMVGAGVARTLAREFKSLEALMDLARSENALEVLTEIEEIGPKIAESIIEFFSLEKNINFISKLRKNKIENNGSQEELSFFIAEEENDSDISLNGKKIVLTGSLEKMSRNEAGDILRKYGAQVTSSVSKKTDLVVYGVSAGSKLKKAKDLGVQTLEGTELDSDQLLAKVIELFSKS